MVYPTLKLMDTGEEITVDNPVFIHRDDKNDVIVDKEGMERRNLGTDVQVSSKRSGIPPYQIKPVEMEGVYYPVVELTSVTNPVTVNGASIRDGEVAVRKSQRVEIGNTEFYIMFPQ